MDEPQHHKPTRWLLGFSGAALVLLGIWVALPVLHLLLFSGAFALAVKLTGVIVIVLYGRFSHHPDDPP